MVVFAWVLSLTHVLASLCISAGICNDQMLRVGISAAFCCLTFSGLFVCLLKNRLGYCAFHLGDYEKALNAYDVGAEIHMLSNNFIPPISCGMGLQNLREY